MWRAFPNPEQNQYKQICMLTHITKDQLKNAAIEWRIYCLSSVVANKNTDSIVQNFMSTKTQIVQVFPN